MDLPINFPSQADVIAEEVRRFRMLTPVQQAWAVGEMVRLYHFLVEHSDRPDVAARLADEDEALGRIAITEFAARHASV